MLARIQQLSEMQFFAMSLHGHATDAEAEHHWGDIAKFERNIGRVYKGMLPP